MKALLRFCIFFAAGYGVLTLVVYLMQRKMIYFPDRTSPPADFMQHVGLKPWPRQGDGFMGYVSAATPTVKRGTVVVFHGNAGAAWHRDYYVHALAPLGYRVILAEYPGYGGRKGEITEGSLVRDARDLVLKAQAGAGGPIYLMGESMGSGVAAAVAADPPVPVAGLVLITPWDSLPDLAQSLYWYLPARWLTRDRYDNVRHLKGFSAPVAVAIAKHDRVVPNRHSLRLFEGLTAPKRLWQFEKADHNSWPTGPQAPWWREVMQFVSDASAESSQDTDGG